MIDEKCIKGESSGNTYVYCIYPQQQLIYIYNKYKNILIRFFWWVSNQYLKSL